MWYPASLVVVLAVVGCSTERVLPDAEPVSGVHPLGNADPSSELFHGRQVERHGWDLTICARCHGDDFRGGAANTSCRDAGCHVDGPTACNTCHEATPTTGAHAVHRGAAVACNECHVVPAAWDDEGHIRIAGQGDPPPAEVTFGARAALTPAFADRAGPPALDGGTCRNVYCHGDVLRAGGLATAPRWTDPVVGGCDRCHGKPPPSHAQDRCATCHPASAPHIDGALAIGTDAGCSGCHGSAGSSAPPRDLSGNLYTTAIGVGAHQAHLAAPSRLRGPIDCATCHLVPSQVIEVGHLDSPPPAEVAIGLGWQHATATCASAWCHGPATPVWTATGGASCGTCHGVPPATPSHTPGQPLTSCATCHPRTIDSTGSIIITPGPTGPSSEHIDGNVDLL